MQVTSNNKPEAGPRRLPHAHFDTAWLPAGQRTEAWRSIMLPQVAVTPTRGALEGTIDAWTLGECELATSHYTAQTARRDRSWLARYAADYYSVILSLSRRVHTCCEQREFGLAPGDIFIDDAGRARETHYGGGRILLVRLPRYLLAEHFPGDDLHGALIRGTSPQGRLLRGHLLELHRQCPRLAPAAVPRLTDATLALTAAALAPSLASRADVRGHVQEALRRQIRQFVDRQLDDPTLDVAAVQRAFRLSRTQLYTLFSDHGGLSTYLRERRLERVAAALRAPDKRHLTIQHLAFEAGFRSERQFQRAFRNRYGRSARQLRNDTLPGRTADRPESIRQRVDQVLRGLRARPPGGVSPC